MGSFGRPHARILHPLQTNQMAKKPRAPRPPRAQPEPSAPKPPEPLDEAVLRRFVFQTFGRARRTQDSPVVPDVWLRYIRIAEDIAHARIAGEKTLPNGEVDLLLTPWSGVSPGDIAQRLRERLAEGERWKAARIAQSTTRVVAIVDFLTLVREVVPLTGWWRRLVPTFEAMFEWFEESLKRGRTLSWALSHTNTDEVELFRYAALVGFIDRLMNADSEKAIKVIEGLARLLGSPGSAETALQQGRRLQQAKPNLEAVQPLIAGFGHATGEKIGFESAMHLAEEARTWASDPRGIFQINLNRPAAQSLFDSCRTVKADAAQRVFEINTEGIAFAVIDGGIDATHAAFLKRSDKDCAKRLDEKEASPLTDEERLRWSRVLATYDFTILRDIIASGGDPQFARDANKKRIEKLAAVPANKQAMNYLVIRNDKALDLDWGIVAPLIKVNHDADYLESGLPGSDHGTHVAGILAAELPVDEQLDPDLRNRPLVGMCPRLSLYDLRVFDSEGVGDEFGILCALEFVGWMNRDRTNPTVHGVNLSLALAHDVDSFACGQTPICEVCNHLVGAGTVVVAAAGNTGFEGGVEKQSLGSGYRPISITDPGNADMVITVGSTHRSDPHLYGVSYFSGRGPTGDGRRKPDILAPGEKITSTIRGGRTQRMDGTSMAAPHVSGAAALLMARYSELIGRPLQIKEILMKSATDLNREPSFQGAGLLDILRALQSV
jgi:serine protease AprX